MSVPEISVVIPAYNEQECIVECVEEVIGVMEGIGREYEVLIVDDGSSDQTFARLKDLREKRPKFRAIKLANNGGITAALAAGIENARGELVITLDADMQNDPADIPRMLDLADKFDVVCGVRRKRRDNLIRRMSSRIANFVRNRLTRESIKDVGCTLRICRRSDLARIKFFDGLHRFLPTLLRMEGCSITEIPVNHRPRSKGKSKYGVWNRLFRSSRDLIAVRWMQSRRIEYEVEEEL